MSSVVIDVPSQVGSVNTSEHRPKLTCKSCLVIIFFMLLIGLILGVHFGVEQLVLACGIILGVGISCCVCVSVLSN